MSRIRLAPGACIELVDALSPCDICMDFEEGIIVAEQPNSQHFVVSCRPCTRPSILSFIISIALLAQVFLAVAFFYPGEPGLLLKMALKAALLKYGVPNTTVPPQAPGATACVCAVVPTHVIGPIIASYLIDRPSSLKLCGRPCPGPRHLRLRQKSTLFPAPRWLCVCDGNGFCAYSADIGQFRTLRCTCSQYCLDTPIENWEHTAWTVLAVLKLRSRGSSQVKQVAASFSR